MLQTCKNCGAAVDNEYCPVCGQKTSTSRFTMKHLAHDFIHGFYHVDHGIFFTAKELLVNPGKMLRDYLSGHRVRYFNPFTFILLVGSLGAFLLLKIKWQSYFIDIGLFSSKAVDQEVWNSSLKHYSFRLLGSILLYSLITKSFYYKKKYNFSENLIANTFLRGELSIIIFIFSPIAVLLQPIDANGIFKTAIIIFMLLYMAWAYAGLFDGRITISTIAKAFFVSLVATLVESVILNFIILKNPL